MNGTVRNSPRVYLHRDTGKILDIGTAKMLTTSGYYSSVQYVA